MLSILMLVIGFCVGYVVGAVHIPKDEQKP